MTKEAAIKEAEKKKYRDYYIVQASYQRVYSSEEEKMKEELKEVVKDLAKRVTQVFNNTLGKTKNYKRKK